MYSTTHRSAALLVGLLLTLALAASACGSTPDTGVVAPMPDTPATSPLPQGSDPVELDPADFTTEIDNPYWPMDVRTRWTYREIDENGNEVAVVIVVTDQTKQIANGITARVVRDTVRLEGEIIEDTFDWYAQDSQGNIWYLGEDTAEFESGQVTSTAGSFEA
ncbi:MAG: hypothetical protein ACR2HR_14230, partial [Euzebya sp.]